MQYYMFEDKKMPYPVLVHPDVYLGLKRPDQVQMVGYPEIMLNCPIITDIAPQKHKKHRKRSSSRLKQRHSPQKNENASSQNSHSPIHQQQVPRSSIEQNPNLIFQNPIFTDSQPQILTNTDYHKQFYKAQIANNSVRSQEVMKFLNQPYQKPSAPQPYRHPIKVSPKISKSVGNSSIVTEFKPVDTSIQTSQLSCKNVFMPKQKQQMEQKDSVISQEDFMQISQNIYCNNDDIPAVDIQNKRSSDSRISDALQQFFTPNAQQSEQQRQLEFEKSLQSKTQSKLERLSETPEAHAPIARAQTLASKLLINQKGNFASTLQLIAAPSPHFQTQTFLSSAQSSSNQSSLSALLDAAGSAPFKKSHLANQLQLDQSENSESENNQNKFQLPKQSLAEQSSKSIADNSSLLGVGFRLGKMTSINRVGNSLLHMAQEESESSENQRPANIQRQQTRTWMNQLIGSEGEESLDSEERECRMLEAGPDDFWPQDGQLQYVEVLDYDGVDTYFEF